MKAPVVRSILAGLLAVLLAGPALAAPGARPASRAASETTLPSRAALVALPLAPRSGPNGDDVARYAARERSTSAPLQAFTGGFEGGIYIGTGALIVALLVVIVILVL